MKYVLEPTGEIAQNKNEAIDMARNHLANHPEETEVYVLRLNGVDIAFIVGYENTEGITNFVKA